MSNKPKELYENIYLDRTIKNQEIKTTNVNILLNRVRQNKKKIFKKRILISLLFSVLVSSLAVFLII